MFIGRHCLCLPSRGFTHQNRRGDNDLPKMYKAKQQRSALLYASTPGHYEAQGLNVLWLGHLFYHDRTHACFSTRAHVQPHTQEPIIQACQVQLRHKKQTTIQRLRQVRQPHPKSQSASMIVQINLRGLIWPNRQRHRSQMSRGQES